MAVTTAAQYALAQGASSSTSSSSDSVSVQSVTTTETDSSTAKLGYITIVNSQINTQLMLVQQFPLY